MGVLMTSNTGCSGEALAASAATYDPACPVSACTNWAWKVLARALRVWYS
ncbi:hypothetical protein MYBA111488_23125 [Mycobacterium basiliense]